MNDKHRQAFIHYDDDDDDDMTIQTSCTVWWFAMKRYELQQPHCDVTGMMVNVQGNHPQNDPKCQAGEKM